MPKLLSINPDLESNTVKSCLSYATVWNSIGIVLGDVKMPCTIKKEAQSISYAVEGEII